MAAFKEVDGSIASRLRDKWRQRIDDWRADKTKPNPYHLEGGKGGGFLVSFLWERDGRLILFFFFSWAN